MNYLQVVASITGFDLMYAKATEEKDPLAEKPEMKSDRVDRNRRYFCMQ